MSYSPAPYVEYRTCAQNERPGALRVDCSWFRNYCEANPAWLIHGWEGMHPEGRKWRAQCFLNFGLKPDVIEKISRLDQPGIKRLMNLITAFEDCFMLSDPERFPLLIYQKEYKRFMRWAISTDVYHPGKATSEWKAFIVLVKWKAVQSCTGPPPLPTTFPGVPRNVGSASEVKFSSFWCALCPWLASVWQYGVRSKMECTRLAHLLTSRNLPAGTKADRSRTLEEHAEVLCGDPGPDNPARSALLHELAYIAGRSIEQKVKVSLSEAHASLTNSASIDSPLNRGGRARAVSERFREWLSFVPQHDVEEQTWFGRPYWLKAGVARWRTMCRDSVATDGLPGDSAYIDEVDFTPGKYKYEDPLYCLDRFTGYQLFQWALEEGIRTGSILGSPFRNDRGLTFGRAPAIRASAIGEPGGKSRVVTVGEDWLTIFLQPLSHALIANLKKDPSARAGLSRAWQGFEYIKSWSTKEADKPPKDEERYILTSDLKTATDFCPRNYSKSLLKGFLAGLNIEGPLASIWVELLTGPRIYEGPVSARKDCFTKRGVLMGDPGSKVVLSLFNKVAEMEALFRYQIGLPNRVSNKYLLRKIRVEGLRNTRFRLFAFAGDDHVAIGPPGYLRELTKCHIRNGMKVSTSSNFISPVAGFYCEEIIFIREAEVWKAWGLQVPLFKQPYAENPHVDALKIRLFSLCTKEHEGKNETNPAIGMSASLRGMIAWFAEGWEVIRPICSYRFAQKMRRLIPENLFLRGLSRSLGGIEAPLFGYGTDELSASWGLIPLPIRKAICLVRREPTAETQAVRRILAKASSATSARGIDLSSIEEEVRSVLSSELCQATPVDQLRPDHIDQLEWDNMRRIDKLKAVSSEGKFIPVGEALQVVMRPYMFRDLLFPEESLKHGIDPFRKRSYRQLSWPSRINRLEQAIVETLGKSESLRDLYLSVNDSEMETARDEIISNLDRPYLASLPKEVYLIPKEVVYTDKLCTLSMPDIAILP